MDFFSDVITPCERCSGSGFSDEVLEIVIDDITIYYVLQITFSEIAGFLDTHLTAKAFAQARSILDLIDKTGLGHLTSGRSQKTLSTGELQRLKLVSGLSYKAGNNTLFLLDEPTGGLHPKDTAKLMTLFNELTEAGNTIVCVSHEPLLMASAAGTIELGPGGGKQGGKIINT